MRTPMNGKRWPMRGKEWYMAIRLAHLSGVVAAMRRRREACGWYKGSALWGRLSVEEGREYAAEMEGK